ncbi:putative golgin subfamily A member 7B [Scophthalmus maximus]|uniref:Putative golgin subfamily A member 7B n=1 Tax=Scophthalmus maximus TaxID=52904 RepID=A0A2U9CE69_SCOMX|nr:putative golgin subfamily A member 7B [Scophthalmus maximus]
MTSPCPELTCRLQITFTCSVQSCQEAAGVDGKCLFGCKTKHSAPEYCEGECVGVHYYSNLGPLIQEELMRAPTALSTLTNYNELRHSASLVTKVFIQRDYNEGTVCRFQSKFPSELDNRIERTLLEETVKTLNSYYAEAEKIGGQSYLEGCLACATAYIIFLCMETRYEKVLRKISGYIQEQNEKIYAPRGLLLTDPIERGMRVVSFTQLLPFSLCQN